MLEKGGALATTLPVTQPIRSCRPEHYLFAFSSVLWRRWMALRRVLLLLSLHFPLLRSVLLLELLSLLSVALFHLLFLRLAGILLRHLLVFFFLLLLQL